MPDDYKRRYPWRRTWPGETGLNGKLLEDYSCYVDGEDVGRISYQDAGATKGKWRWDGGHSNRYRERIMPQGGYVGSLLEAVQKVEDHFDMVKAAHAARKSIPPGP